MRLLKELLKNNSTVWIYCESEALQKHFLKQAEAEGFLSINGQVPSQLFHHQLYGISDDMTVGYLAAMIWSLTFQTGKDDHVRVDYSKYISDDEDYYCHSTKLKRIDYSDWNQLAYSTVRYPTRRRHADRQRDRRAHRAHDHDEERGKGIRRQGAHLQRL